jgi:hypothetical protein
MEKWNTDKNIYLISQGKEPLKQTAKKAKWDTDFPGPAAYAPASVAASSSAAAAAPIVKVPLDDAARAAKKAAKRAKKAAREAAAQAAALKAAAESGGGESSITGMDL